MALPSSREEIVWKLHLASPPEEVFALLSTDDGRERFWCEKSRQSGDRIVMYFINGVETETLVRASEPPTCIAFRYFDSDVVFELAPDGRGGTDLTLRNRGVPDDEYEEVLAGWLNVLFPLKGVADFGIDLRSHDPERLWDDGYIDQ
ncbi:MAG: SRPBCC family protein [Parasphingopyxis sp.]|uniref:SRPBCC family protein n=1 Tax=Parasphingopyxis sp. TaxID=1920299 RepID=UPI003F9ED404